MSCDSSGVLQPSGLIDAAFLHSAELSSSRKFDVRWANAESRIADLLYRIQPNGHSELLRKAVSDYISGLVQKCLDCKVVRFGSVPLKTYLPDGDIDLTAFSNHQELRDSWALDVQTVLEHEVQRKDAEFTVSNVQCIHAEVKIVKCVVESVVVDISFNQLGGVCTLCFLEEVDRLVQKDHLFKRSIILVKAWCYYESRILGAHHALISTYALETLVLYIFNVFHSTLRGPLEVLFTFLDYFSKFDWEHYCVSLWGPVRLASLADLTEPPLKDGSNLLLSKDFLEKCSALYDVFPKGGDTQARTFCGKYLNIVDPLQINNNLGRSVSQANFHRIRSAFHLGACQLAKVFDASDEDFPKCLDEFFSNTWERHQSGHRSDAPNSIFPPYEKFVYKTGYFDMLGDHGVKYLFELPELENSSYFSAEKKVEDGASSSQILQSGSLTEDIKMQASEWTSARDVEFQVSKSSKGFLNVEGSEMYNGHNGITGPTVQVRCPVLKTNANMQSTLMCSMPLVVSTDSQSMTSSHRKGGVEKRHSMASKHTSQALASLEILTSERRPETSVDEDMKSCCSPRITEQITVARKTDNQGHFLSGSVSPEGWNGSQMSKTEVSLSKEAGETSAVLHGQSNGSIGFIGGGPTSGTRESLERPAAGRATLNSTCTNSMVGDSIIAKDNATEKSADFLFPLYAPGIHSSFSACVSSSSSSLMASSLFHDPSVLIEADVKARNTSSVQISPSILSTGASGRPVSADAQSFSKYNSQFNGLFASQILNQQQKFEEQHEQFQCSKQAEQALHTSNVDWEQSGLLSSNNGSTTYTEAQRSNDATDISLMGNAAVPLEIQGCSKLNEKDQKIQPSRQDCTDAHHRPRRKGVRYKGPEVLPTKVSVPKTTIPGPSQGLSSAAGVIQRPFNFVDAPQSVLFGATVAKASPVPEGGHYMAQSSATFCSAIPMISYHNPFYPPFPVNNFNPHIQHEHKAFMDGLSREKLPHIYHSSRQMSESTAAALSARFASLSAEESGLEPQQDLLRSDLANHLQNLEFGRWCQEPLLQPLLEPPYLYQSVQESYMWSIPPFLPLHGSSNQMVDNLKGPTPAIFPPHNVGGMSHIGTLLPRRKDMYRDLKSLSPPGSSLHGQRPMPKKNHLSSMSDAPAAPALVSLPSLHDTYNVPTAQVFVNEQQGATGSNFSNHTPGRTSPFVAGQLEFGSLGPIEIRNLPCSNTDTKLASRNNPGATGSDSCSSFFETYSNKEACTKDKLREES